MTRSRRMKTIVNLTENQKQDAAQQLAHSQQLLNESETQLLDMKRSREDYARQLHSLSPDPRKASELQGIRVFIQQLDIAIQQLERQLLDRKSVYEIKKEHWMKLRNKSRVLIDIKSRYQKTEQNNTERREQFEVDELSQRKGD